MGFGLRYGSAWRDAQLEKAKSYLCRKWDLIENKNFKELYRVFSGCKGSLTYWLYEAGIDPLKYLDYIPCEFFSYLSLDHLDIPTSVTRLKGWSVCYCDDLITLELPQSVIEIEPHSIVHCESLENIIIPDSVQKLGYCLAVCCNNLKSVRLPEKFKSDRQLARIFNLDSKIAVSSLKEKINIV